MIAVALLSFLLYWFWKNKDSSAEAQKSQSVAANNSLAPETPSPNTLSASQSTPTSSQPNSQTTGANDTAKSLPPVPSVPTPNQKPPPEFLFALKPLGGLTPAESEHLVSLAKGEIKSRHWLLHEENDGFAIRDTRGPGDTRHWFAPKINAGVYVPGGVIMEINGKIKINDRWAINPEGDFLEIRDYKSGGDKRYTFSPNKYVNL